MFVPRILPNDIFLKSKWLGCVWYDNHTNFVPGRGPMDLCPGQGRVYFETGRVGKKKVPCLTEGGTAPSWGLVVLRDSVDRELRPILHLLLGPPWLNRHSDRTRHSSGSRTEARPSNHFQQAKWLCNFLFKFKPLPHQSTHTRWLGDLSLAHSLPITSTSNNRLEFNLRGSSTPRNAKRAC